MASGTANVANVPSVAAAVPPAIQTVTAMTYLAPEDLDEGGVLVVGASATGGAARRRESPIGAASDEGVV